ncbi:AAA-type ATPase lid domain-containing protein [Arboricoccus pini]
MADILLPRLVERPDFALLLAVLAKEAAPGARIEEKAAAMLARHDWQGNMRELHNVLTRLALQGEDARIGLRI